MLIVFLSRFCIFVCMCVLISDFGHAIAIKESQANIRGTDSWAAPELDHGGRATIKSDIFSFGLVVHFILSGEQHDAVRVTYPHSWNHTWVELMKCCLARDPERRPSHDCVISHIAKLSEFPIGRSQLQLVLNKMNATQQQQ